MSRPTEHYNRKIYSVLNESLLGSIVGLFLDKKTRSEMKRFRAMVRRDPELKVQLDALLKSSARLRGLIDNYCERYPDASPKLCPKNRKD